MHFSSSNSKTVFGVHFQKLHTHIESYCTDFGSSALYQH